MGIDYSAHNGAMIVGGRNDLDFSGCNLLETYNLGAVLGSSRDQTKQTHRNASPLNAQNTPSNTEVQGETMNRNERTFQETVEKGMKMTTDQIRDEIKRLSDQKFTASTQESAMRNVLGIRIEIEFKGVPK